MRDIRDEEAPIYFALLNARALAEQEAREAEAEQEAREFYQRVNNQHHAFKRKLREAGAWQ